MLVGGDSGFQLLPLSHRLPRPSRHGGSVKGRSATPGSKSTKSAESVLPGVRTHLTVLQNRPHSCDLD